MVMGAPVQGMGKQGPLALDILDPERANWWNQICISICVWVGIDSNY
uniref:Uncharacterized protein n=2 Tax=Picea TaxID=3328 RepID=A0A101M3H8_PICGL|nr:hypothetical protein ABT39_MTgene224 [Picea glauca]QHR90099.1 hypothetical protein Q903MT_gene4122 [Picea sitchensis]